MARAAVKRRDYLIRMGLAKRKMPKKDKAAAGDAKKADGGAKKADAGAKPAPAEP